MLSFRKTLSTFKCERCTAPVRRNWQSSLCGNFFIRGAKNGLGFCENYFLGIGFRKTETNLNLHFVRAEEGSGEESARENSVLDFSGARIKFKLLQITC